MTLSFPVGSPKELGWLMLLQQVNRGAEGRSLWGIQNTALSVGQIGSCLYLMGGKSVQLLDCLRQKSQGKLYI